jgi:hypothetical protein
MSLTFRIRFLLFFGFILLQAKGLSPGNADACLAVATAKAGPARMKEERHFWRQGDRQEWR